MRFPKFNFLSCAAILALSSSGAMGQSETAEQLARKLNLPRVVFKEATAREAIEFLRRKSEGILGPGHALNINFIGREELLDERTNLSVWDTPLLEILQIVASQTNLSLGATDKGLYLYPMGEFPLETNGLRSLGWSKGSMKVLGTAIYSAGRRDAFAEAQKLIEEALGDRFKAPKEVRDLIDAIKKRAEEAETRIRESNSELQEKKSGRPNDGK